MNLNDVVINPKDSNAINYVRSRCAIEENMPNRATKRAAKLAVIEHFGGQLQQGDRGHNGSKIVVFPDSTKARF